MHSARGLALLGPGLDGQLALEMVRRHGCEVIAVTFATPFTTHDDTVVAAAALRGVSLVTLRSGDDFLDRIAHPRFGYTREMEPALDCKVAMLVAAREQMQAHRASFLITGDVVGQRLPGQSKRDLALVDFHAGVEGLVLRPLSAQLLEPSLAEQRGYVRREDLLSLNGRSRQPQFALAKSFGWSDLPSVTSGSFLADAAYAKKLRDALAHDANWRAELPLLALGRHFRLRHQARAVLGRTADENDRLAAWHAQHPTTGLLCPGNFVGPTALLSGTFDDDSTFTTARLVLKYAKKTADDFVPRFVFSTAGGSESEISLPLTNVSTSELPAPIG